MPRTQEVSTQSLGDAGQLAVSLFCRWSLCEAREYYVPGEWIHYCFLGLCNVYKVCDRDQKINSTLLSVQKVAAELSLKEHSMTIGELYEHAHTPILQSYYRCII